MIFQEFSGLEKSISVLWGISATGLTWLLLHNFRGGTPAQPEAGGDQRLAHKLPPLLQLLLPITQRPALFFHRPQFAAWCAHLEKRLVAAGYEDTVTPQEFLALCLLAPLCWGTLMAAAVLGIFAGAGDPFSARPLALALALVIWTASYPRQWLKKAVATRHREILRALPFVMDLLTISVEAGLDFMTAIRNINERRKLDALGEELGRVLFAIQLGKTRREALQQMAERIGQPDIQSLITALTQADEMGVSLGATLRIQADQIRAKRFLRAEKLAHEAPVKMLFPLIAFIFPAVFLVLMGPLILQVLRQGF